MEYLDLNGHFKKLMQNISEIETLIKLISKLPGLGPKSAKRIILKLFAPFIVLIILNSTIIRLIKENS